MILPLTHQSTVDKANARFDHPSPPAIPSTPSDKTAVWSASARWLSVRVRACVLNSHVHVCLTATCMSHCATRCLFYSTTFHSFPHC